MRARAVGSRPRVADLSAGRSAARRARAAGRAARAGAEASLRGRSGTRLGRWETLDEPELDLLLELLAVARRHGAHHARSAVTGDGRWRVTFTEPDGGSGTASLQTPHGRLVTADYRFELEPAR